MKTTQTKLLRDASLTIRKNPGTGLYKVTLCAFHGPTKCNQTVGHFHNRKDARAAAADCAIDRSSFTRQEWNVAKATGQ